MAVEYNFTLDMDRSKRDNNIVYARTGDLDSIVINADLVFDGAPYTPTGENAFFECVTPNGCSVRSAAEKTGSSVSVEVPSAAFQAAGVINVAYFRFETGETASPTYVESTEPFAIVVREGIGDNIDTGDYIEGWRLLADQIEALKEEVEQKAQQAETAINEQKEEVDQLKAQAQKAIAGDVIDVEEVAQSAITAINQEKADVAEAAEGITEAGEQAISKFNTNSQQAISQFNSDGASAVNQFNTNSQQAIDSFNADGVSAIGKFNSDGTSAIDQFNSKSTSAIDQFNTDAGDKLDEVDGMITEAQGNVNAAITQLETATSQAVDAMEDALDGTTAGSLQNAINRTLKLDVADMTEIPNNSSLSSFTNVGSYCCKTAAVAATVGDCPIDDSPFNMYVFSSATSGQVMQLVVPIDLNGKPTAEWHVRFGTSSAMDPWSVIGGGADIAAGLGIDVTGDAQKTVALDTAAFYEHVGPSLIISGSTEVTGGGRVKELRVKGKTVKNLWPVIAGVQDGLTIATDETGLITVSGTATASGHVLAKVSGLAENKNISAVKSGGTIAVSLQAWNAGAYVRDVMTINTSASTANTGTGFDTIYARINYTSGETYNASFRVMLVEGSEAPDCFVPTGLHSVEPTKLVTAGAESGDSYEDMTETALPSVELRSLPNGTCDELVIKSDGTATVERQTYNELFNGGTGIATNSYVPIEADGYQYVALNSTKDKPKGANISMLAVISDRFATGQRAPGNVLLTTGAVSGDGRNYIALLFCFEPGTFADADEVRRWFADNPTNVCFAGMPETEPQTPVTLPDLASPNYAVYATSNIPAEIEAEVVKVDYLPPSDVYTKAEVDKKIEDAGGMPDVVPVSQGGTGVTTAAAERNRLGLGNTTGALPVANGGTGAADAKAAQYNLLNSIAAVEGDSDDSSLFAFAYASPSSATGALYKRTGSNVWNWIISKIRSAFGFSSSNVLPVSNGGTGSNTPEGAREAIGAGTSNFSGSYNDLADKPQIPSVPVSVANGGTGGTSAKAAQNSLLNDMNESSDPLTDSSMLVGYNASPSDSDGAVHKRSVTTIWNYVAGKIRSTFGFNSSNVLDVEHGGTGFNDFPAMLVDLESASTASPYQIAPRPGVTGTLPVSHGGTGATAPGVDMLSNLGITFGNADPPSTGTPGSIYIQYFE